jgi:hypothetical protein
MPTLNVDAKIVKHIADGVASKTIDSGVVTLKIYEKRLLVRQTNPSMSGMFSLLSETVDWDGDDVEISISIADMKTLAKLVTDCKVSVILGDGLITCKTGKVTKKFPLIEKSEFVDTNPKPTMPFKFSVSDEIVKAMKDAFSDINEGAVEITAEGESVKLSVRDVMTVRNTEIVITKEDCSTWVCPGKAISGFRIELFQPMLGLKLKDSDAIMEFDNKKPLAFIQEVDGCFKSKILLAPIIFDD